MATILLKMEYKSLTGGQKEESPVSIRKTSLATLYVV